MPDDFVTNGTEAPTATVGGAVFDIRKLSPADLGRLGLQQIAYVKPVVVNGTHAFAIHAADGTPMALAPNRTVAVAAIVQHEMVPTLVH